MDKAVLVIDMPANCYECSLNNYHFCDVTGEGIEEYRNTEYKPNFCPLRKMPYKKKYNTVFDAGIFGINPEVERACVNGWNACIDEILKEM